jgi:endonuclease YncB( thermonuclease family)
MPLLEFDYRIFHFMRIHRCQPVKQAGRSESMIVRGSVLNLGTNRRRCVLFLAILAFLFVDASFSIAAQYEVTRVTDGDTIQVKAGGTNTIVRLVGIDAPEVSHSKNQPGQPFGKAATKHLAAMVLNKTVEIKSYGPDRYGRTLAEVFLGDRNINIEMIRAGLSEGYRGKPASGLDMAPYRKAEEEARAAKRGMWVLAEKYVSPRDWRRVKVQ